MSLYGPELWKIKHMFLNRLDSSSSVEQGLPYYVQPANTRNISLVTVCLNKVIIMGSDTYM